MSPADTIQVLSHEIAHSMMHNQEMLDNETSYDFTKSIKEMEADKQPKTQVKKKAKEKEIDRAS